MTTRFDNQCAVYLMLSIRQNPDLSRETLDWMKDAYMFAAQVWFPIGFDEGSTYRKDLMLKALDLDEKSLARKAAKEKEIED